MTNRILYDREAAAEMLSTSARRIDDLRRGRKLLAVQDGNEWKFLHADLEAYAQSLVSSAAARSA